MAGKLFTDGSDGDAGILAGDRDVTACVRGASDDVVLDAPTHRDTVPAQFLGEVLGAV